MNIYAKAMALSVSAGIVLSACSTAPSVNFYSMVAPAEQASASAAQFATQPAATPIAILVTALPEQVDRPQIVTRFDAAHGHTGVMISEDHRWAESLQAQIAQVLADRLAVQLGNPFISADGKGESAQAEVRLAINVQHFDAQPGREVVVDLIWSAANAKTERSSSGHALARVALGNNDYAALVLAYRQALSEIAPQIGERLLKDGVYPQ